MKYIYLLLFFIGSCSIFSQITYNPNYNAAGPQPPGSGGNQPAVIIDGTQTGDDLRAYILANPAFNIGTITDNDTKFNAELVINNNANFTDNNAVYHFPNFFRYIPEADCTVTFTAVSYTHLTLPTICSV